MWLVVSIYLGVSDMGGKSQTLKDGLPLDAQWLDEPELEIVKQQSVKLETSKDPGGSKNDPPC